MQSTTRTTRCHREASPAPRTLQLVFDDVGAEPVVLAQLSHAYGPGRERATQRVRVHSWEVGRREVSLSASPERLVMVVQSA